MSVYFIQHGKTGPIKVGFSRTPSKRIKEIANICPDPISIVAVIDGSHGLEQRIHRAFRQHRHRGEWLKPSLEVQQFANLCKVATLSQIKDALTAIEACSANRIVDLNATGAAFSAIISLALHGHTAPANLAGFSNSTGISEKRLLSVRNGSSITIAELTAIANAVPEIAEVLSIVCGDNLKRLEDARDALDDLIKRRVRVAS